MKTMKVFKTSDMPKEVWEKVYNAEFYVKDGFFLYRVGDFAKEIAKQPSAWHAGSAETARIIDEWLISDGATDGENILIEHG